MVVLKLQNPNRILWFHTYTTFIKTDIEFEAVLLLYPIK